VASQNGSPEVLVTFRAPGSDRGVEPAQVVAGMPFEVPDPAESVRSALAKGFLLAFERVAGLFQESVPRRVELELVEEGAPPCTPVRLDLQRSTGTDDAFFRVTAPLARAEVFAARGLPDPAFPLGTGSAWVHEIVHLRDEDALAGFHSALAADVAYDSGAWTFGDEQHLHLREWEFLCAVAPFRHEGIPQLWLVLTGQEAREEAPSAVQELFRREFEALLLSLQRPFLPGEQSTERRTAMETIRRGIRGLTHLAGPQMVLDAVLSRRAILHLPPLPPGLESRAIALVSGQPSASASASAAPLAPGEAALFLEPAFRMGVGAFVEALANPNGVHPWKPFVTLEELSRVCRHLATRGDERDTGFLTGIQAAFSRGDVGTFRRLLQAETGDPMEMGEIVERWEKRRTARRAAVAKPGPHDGEEELETEVDALFDAVLHRRIELQAAGAPERDLADLVLTYAVQEYDYVDDRTRGLGLIDDLYVLRVGAAFLGTSAPG